MGKESEEKTADLTAESLRTDVTKSPQYAANMVAHFVCVLFSGFIIYTAKPGSSLFSWHPTLMSIAFMLFVAEAILLFSPESSLLRKSDRKTKAKYHWILMLMGLASALTGAGVIWYNKELAGRAHATSNHGTIGYIVCLYLATQCCFGPLLLYPSVAAKIVKVTVLKSLHALSGCFLFLLACLAIISGMNSTWFTNAVTGTSWYACIACPIVLLSITVNQVAASVLGRTGFTSKKTSSTKK